jgi:hypothetical protein
MRVMRGGREQNLRRPLQHRGEPALQLLPHAALDVVVHEPADDDVEVADGTEPVEGHGELVPHAQQRPQAWERSFGQVVAGDVPPPEGGACWCPADPRVGADGRVGRDQVCLLVGLVLDGPTVRSDHRDGGAGTEDRGLQQLAAPQDIRRDVDG